jgi:uncharacterized protein
VDVDVLVLAKEPVPGRVKTRLCPPCSARQAAEIAAAALADTFDAACRAGADRVVAVLDGAPGDWLPPGVTVWSQGRGSFNDRLARAWRTTRGPAVQIGMDTPQVTPTTLREACDAVTRADAVLGPARDGGWWLLGMRRPRGDVFHGVRPSQRNTGARQLQRLRALGMAVHMLETLRDVDTWPDALSVAAGAPATRFATAVASMTVSA